MPLELPDVITIGEKYRPAMEMTDPEEARAYFDACVQHGMRHGITREEAEEIERQNLGYFAGYYDHATRQRVERLFQCTHPLLGKAGEAPMSAETILHIGMRHGEQAREEENSGYLEE